MSNVPEPPARPKPMTVAEFIEKLREIVEDDPPVANYRLLLSRDSEGNGYSEVYYDIDRPPFSLEFAEQANFHGVVELAFKEENHERNSLVIWPG